MHVLPLCSWPTAVLQTPGQRGGQENRWRGDSSNTWAWLHFVRVYTSAALAGPADLAGYGTTLAGQQRSPAPLYQHLHLAGMPLIPACPAGCSHKSSSAPLLCNRTSREACIVINYFPPLYVIRRLVSQKQMPLPSHNWALKGQGEALKDRTLLWDRWCPYLPSACSQALFGLELA